MNYRILRICGALGFSQDFYDSAGLAALDYQEQISRLLSQNHPPPGSWSQCMSSLGNESADILINFVPVQKQWCKENNVSIDFSEKGWVVKLLFEHIRVYKPDVVFFYAGCFTWFSGVHREELRKTYPFIRVITGLWGDELSGQASYGKAFANADVVFTSTPLYKQKFDRVGIPAYVLGNCFDHLIAQNIKDPVSLQPEWPITFTGFTGFGCDQHRQRYAHLVKIMEMTDLHVWTDESDLKKVGRRFKPSFASVAKWPVKTGVIMTLNTMSNSRLKKIREASWCTWTLAKYIDAILMKRKGEPVKGQYFIDKEKIADMFPDRCYTPLIRGEDYYSLIANSKISLNCHRDEEADYGNIRVYEATGLGSCLVTDRGDEMKDLFIADKEIVTYKTWEEAVDKIKYLLDHEDERLAIANAGKQRTLSQHTVAHRCEKIHEVICATMQSL